MYRLFSFKLLHLLSCFFLLFILYTAIQLHSLKYILFLIRSYEEKSVCYLPWRCVTEYPVGERNRFWVKAVKGNMFYRSVQLFILHKDFYYIPRTLSAKRAVRQCGQSRLLHKALSGRGRVAEEVHADMMFTVWWTC